MDQQSASETLNDVVPPAPDGGPRGDGETPSAETSRRGPPGRPLRPQPVPSFRGRWPERVSPFLVLMRYMRSSLVPHRQLLPFGLASTFQYSSSLPHTQEIALRRFRRRLYVRVRERRRDPNVFGLRCSLNGCAWGFDPRAYGLSAAVVRTLNHLGMEHLGEHLVLKVPEAA